jgi:hypothetical protein
MIEFIKRFFRRRYIKYLIWVRYKKFEGATGELPLGPNERLCKSICHKLINQDDSKFLIAPISGKRYIKNSRLGLFIILDDRRISITNHVYHYDVSLNEREWDRLSKMYDNKTEKIRQDFEKEMVSQIKNSLNSILEKIQGNI